MEDFKEDIKKAIQTLKAGGIILYPTDTIWGLGCDATNEVAVKKIFEPHPQKGDLHQIFPLHI